MKLERVRLARGGRVGRHGCSLLRGHARTHALTVDHGQVSPVQPAPYRHSPAPRATRGVPGCPRGARMHSAPGCRVTRARVCAPHCPRPVAISLHQSCRRPAVRHGGTLQSKDEHGSVNLSVRACLIDTSIRTKCTMEVLSGEESHTRSGGTRQKKKKTSATLASSGARRQEERPCEARRGALPRRRAAATQRCVCGADSGAGRALLRRGWARVGVRHCCSSRLCSAAGAKKRRKSWRPLALACWPQLDRRPTARPLTSPQRAQPRARPPQARSREAAGYIPRGVKSHLKVLPYTTHA